MSSFLRLGIRLFGVLALMLLVELGSFLLYRERGLNRLFWVPLSFGLVAVAGFDTVKRLPLVWGALTGALLAGVTNLLSWLIGAWVMDGRFRLPEEAEPLLVATSLLMAATIGAIIGVAAGAVARGRRRQRSRRSALGKLAYTAFDEPRDEADEVAEAVSLPMSKTRDRR
jgi:hypothetical protein